MRGLEEPNRIPKAFDASIQELRAPELLGTINLFFLWNHIEIVKRPVVLPYLCPPLVPGNHYSL